MGRQVSRKPKAGRPIRLEVLEGGAPLLEVLTALSAEVIRISVKCHYLVTHVVTRYLFETNRKPSMEMSFFALPSKQGPVQGRFKPVHLPISLSTEQPSSIRRGVQEGSI